MNIFKIIGVISKSLLPIIISFFCNIIAIEFFDEYSVKIDKNETDKTEAPSLFDKIEKFIKKIHKRKN